MPQVVYVKVPDWLLAMVNSKATPQQIASAVAGKADRSELNGMATASGVQAGLEGKADKAALDGKANATAVSDLGADVSKKANVVIAGVMKDKPRVWADQVTVSGGNAVFYLTDDRTATGNAVFSNVAMESIQLTVLDDTAPAAVGTPTLSANKKTLTVPVKRAAGINVSLVGLTLLGVPSAANGAKVNLLCLGDKA